MHVLWLRYLTEIDENTREIPESLLDSPEIRKAVTALEESAFTKEQLLGYEKFWDIISVEKTLYSSAERKGMEKGIREEKLRIASNALKQGLSPQIISQLTGLSIEEIKNI